MIHPHTSLSFISDDIGYGVVATQAIPRGTITWVRDDLDQVITSGRLRRMETLCRQIVEKYCFRDGAGDHILCWDMARFMNHSCDPTCLSPGYNFEIAVRDIQAGEELTDDYGMLNIDSAFRCLCGKARCRSEVTPQDVVTHADAWDGQIRECFHALRGVDQPLWHLVREKAEVEAALNGQRPIASCKTHFRLLNGVKTTVKARRARAVQAA
jgi:hypothetical protein